MSKSLQDQLLGAGLVDKKKAKQISKQKHKQRKVQQKTKEVAVNEAQELAEKARKEKHEKDLQLNLQRKEEAERKAIQAQIIQLINLNKLDRRSGDVAFNFSDGKSVKKIMVTNEISDRLSNGRLCIAKLGEKYEVIARPVVDKILERDQACIIVDNYNANQADNVEEESEEDDYYAQFEIPDDLMW